MSLKDKLEATKKYRESLHRKMVQVDAAIKRAKDSGKLHGRLEAWGKESAEHRASIATLDELIQDLENDISKAQLH